MYRLVLAFLLAAPAFADSPAGYYASGWPIALAEAACYGDEGCLTRLANCGPGADCADTAALCRHDYGQASAPAFRPCTLHRHGGGTITVQIPRQPGATLSTWPAMMDGAKARREGNLKHGSACWRTEDRRSLCLTVLRSEKDLAPWAPK
ncbi:MAG: hypothetical protein AAFY38_00780 [Pseudomonadota bacterium]